MTPEQIADAEDALRGLLDPAVARLMRPSLRAEHAPVVEVVERLPWNVDPIDVVAGDAFQMVADATRSGGIVDPKDDNSDVPWAMTVKKLVSHPALGSKIARRWFAYTERLLWEDVEVSVVAQAVSAYAVARFEDDLDHAHGVWRWMMTASIQTEGDARVGLGTVVAIRAAKLLTWRG